MIGRSSRCIFVTKNELIPKIPYIEKLMIFNSVPGPLQDAQKCKNDTISIVLHCSKELKQIKKNWQEERADCWVIALKTTNSADLFCFSSPPHCISSQKMARVCKQDKLYWNSLLGAIELGLHHLIASANINKWSWKTIVLNERRLTFDTHDPIDKLLRHSSCLQNIVSLRRAGMPPMIFCFDVVLVTEYIDPVLTMFFPVRVKWLIICS